MEAPKVVIELKNYGMQFFRTKDGKIYQQAFGGQAYRCAFVADRTRHALVHTFFGQGRRYNVQFFVEYFASNMLMNSDGSCHRVIALNMKDGTLHRFQVANTILVTGEYGRNFSTTLAHTSTSSGKVMFTCVGFSLQDLMYVQFHPIGIYGVGCLITERFYGKGDAPTAKELASRDFPRSMTMKIRDGRGVRTLKDHIYQHVNHLTLEVLNERLIAAIDYKKETFEMLKETSFRFQLVVRKGLWIITSFRFQLLKVTFDISANSKQYSHQKALTEVLLKASSGITNGNVERGEEHQSFLDTYCPYWSRMVMILDPLCQLVKVTTYGSSEAN
ncbi:hypothetical protein V6N13_098685 [Hibiscus sabdariffa]